MKRLFWLSVGAGAGVYASHRVKRRVERFARAWSPDNVAARAVASGQDAGERLRHRIRDFTSDVRTEMAAREEELREAVRLDQAPPTPDEAGPRRILRAARYSIIDDKDGH